LQILVRWQGASTGVLTRKVQRGIRSRANVLPGGHYVCLHGRVWRGNRSWRTKQKTNRTIVQGGKIKPKNRLLGRGGGGGALAARKKESNE